MCGGWSSFQKRKQFLGSERRVGVLSVVEGMVPAQVAGLFPKPRCFESFVLCGSGLGLVSWL